MKADEASSEAAANVAVRRRYHHGDLANALIQEATAMAREGGPDAVVLREAARRVGVSPTAAYRHFAAHEDLLHKVKIKAQDALASAMERAVAEMPLSGSPAEDALRRSYAIGEAYVNFALAEPGLFRTAFVHIDGARLADPCAPVAEGGSEPVQPSPGVEGFRSFQLLGSVLDDLVANGLLPAERRPNAEFAPWSAVHGLATLLLDGPLDMLPEEERSLVLRSTLDTIVKGLVDGTN